MMNGMLALSTAILLRQGAIFNHFGTYGNCITCMYVL